IFASGCTIDVKDEKVLVLAKSSPNAERKTFSEGKWSDWEEQGDNPIIVVSRFGKGKVVALGNFSIITSLSSVYGLEACDNFKLIGNIFAWLSNKRPEGEDAAIVYLNIGVEQDLYFWMERELKKKRFSNLNQMVNFALNAMRESLESYDVENESKE
ncbi:MAG: hypothetical protein ACTSVI_11080, partial [Promethearchaeota archaeon]